MKQLTQVLQEHYTHLLKKPFFYVDNLKSQIFFKWRSEKPYQQPTKLLLFVGSKNSHQDGKFAE